MHWYKTYPLPSIVTPPGTALGSVRTNNQCTLPYTVACIQLKFTRALHGQPLAICSQAWYHPLVTRRLLFDCFILAEIQAGPDGRIVTAVALQLSQKTRKTIRYHCIRYPA